VKAWINGLTFSGSTLRVTVADAVPADHATLAVATALRVFDRFPALDRVVMNGGGQPEATLARADAESLLAPIGLAALKDRGRWPQVLARAVQRFTGAQAGGGEPGTRQSEERGAAPEAGASRAPSARVSP
jgi:hypothetical protein